ncbi:MAG TPA: hypothetical protein VFZ63_15285 [Jiangellaceae bacterium]
MTIDETRTTDVATGSFRELRDALAGDDLAPVDQGYDDARRVWNGVIDRYPAAIARCASGARTPTAVSTSTSPAWTTKPTSTGRRRTGLTPSGSSECWRRTGRSPRIEAG